MANTGKRREDARRRKMTGVHIVTPAQKPDNWLEELEKEEQKLTGKRTRRSAEEKAPAPRKKAKAAPAGDASPREEAAVVRWARRSGKTVKNGFQVVVNTRHKRLRRFIAVVLIAAVVLLTLNALAPMGLWEYSQNLFAGFGSGDGFPVEISAADGNRLIRVGRDVALIGDASVNLYKSNGRLLYSRTHGFAEAAAVANSSRLLVYDRGGIGVRMENRAETVFSMEAKGGITDAVLAQNGWFALTTRGVDYLSEVTVYDKNGNSRFVWHSANRQILYAGLSSNGRYLGVATLQAEGGTAASDLMLFDTRKGVTLAEEPCKGSVPMAVTCSGSTALFVMNDKLVSIKKSQKLGEISFDESSLLCFDTTPSYGAALVLGRYQNQSQNRLLTVRYDLDVIGDAPLGQDASAMSATGSYVAVQGGDGMKLYNRKGKFKKDLTDSGDVRQFVCRGGKTVVLGSGQLSLVG